MRQPIIEVREISKDYGRNRILDSVAKHRIALSKVSFDIFEGDRVALIGSNGSGKSTLLAILSGMIKPTTGRAVVRGRVASILDIGANFNQELTGYDNTVIYFKIQGLDSTLLADFIQKVEKFSGLEEFFNRPLKVYSKGMVLRLAFAAAFFQDADIYLIDEVLSVGDEAFRSKIEMVFDEFVKQGKTIIFATHNKQEVAAMSSRCIWVEKGVLQMDDVSANVVPRYSKFQRIRFEEETKENREAKIIFSPNEGEDVVSVLFADEYKSEYLVLNEVSVKSSPDKKIFREEDITVSLGVDKLNIGYTLSGLVKIRDQFGHPVLYTLSVFNADEKMFDVDFKEYKGKLTFEFVIPKNTITSGEYYISIWFGKDVNPQQPHYNERAYYFPHEVQFNVSNKTPEFLSEPVHYSVQPALKWSVKPD